MKVAPFSTLHASLLLRCGPGTSSPHAITVRRMLMMQELMETIQAQYDAADEHVVRPAMEHYLRSSIEERLNDTMACTTGDLRDHLLHLVRCLAAQPTARLKDPLVSKWARIAREVHADGEVSETLAAIVDGAEGILRPLVSSFLFGVASECSTRGTPLMPFLPRA